MLQNNFLVFGVQIIPEGFEVRSIPALTCGTYYLQRLEQATGLPEQIVRFLSQQNLSSGHLP